MRVPRLALLLLLPAVAALSGCTDTYQVAASVGDLEISHTELRDEAEEWQANAQLAGQLGATSEPVEGRAPQSVVTEVLNLRIQAELARLGLEQAGVDVAADQQFAAIREQASTQFGQLFDPFSDELRNRVLDDVAVLQYAGSAGVGPAPADVYVSPRYGTVGAGGVLIAPEGPAAGGRAIFGS